MANISRKAEITETLLSLSERFIRWAPHIIGVSGVGAVSGWSASMTGALDNFAPFSWVLAAMIGAVLFLIAAMAFAAIRVKLSERRILQRHEIELPPFNPLDDLFTRQKIDIQQFKKPLPLANEGKSFIGCEIYGPAVVLFGNNSTIIDNEVMDCDFIVTKNKASVCNVILFTGVTIKNCKLINLTLLMPPNLARELEKAAPGANWITEIPNEQG